MTEVISPAQVAKTRRETQLTVQPLVQQAGALVVTDALTYQLADSLRSRIRAAKKVIEERLDPIIKPIYTGLESLYELKRELVQPLDKAERDIKGMMTGWQIEESRRIAAEQRAKFEEESRLRREAEEKQRKAEAAKTQAAARLLANQAAKLQEKADLVTAQPIEQVAQAVGSNIRRVKRWRVNDLKAFVQAVVDGEAPLIALTTNDEAINSILRTDPMAVESWPGVEVYEDIQIVQRRS